jgi:hypothetical protein
MSEKSILEQALLQVQTLEEAVKHNAKGILASTMKQELSDLLKESLEDEEEKNPMDEETPEEEATDDMSDEEDETADDEEADDTSDDENVDDLDNDETTDDESMDSEDDDTDTSMDDMGGEDTEPSFDGMGDDSEEGSEDDDVMDMTGASDDEVLKVFKAMKPEDGIVVKKDGNKLEVNDGEDEYIIKLDDDGDDTEVDEDYIEGATEPTDESLYEIELDEDEDAPYEKEVKSGMNESKGGDPYTKKAKVKTEVHEAGGDPYTKKAKVKTDVHEEGGDPYTKKAKVSKDVHEEEDMEEGENSPFDKKATKKVQADEARRTKSNPHGDKNDMDRAGIKSKKVYKAGSGSINEEVETLKKQNAEYKKALVLFKDKLNEVAVFNANLAYATRLFTEHSTTKQEKLSILKRFDTVSTLNESKGLYNTIASELGNKTTVTESVADKIVNTPSSSSTEVLSESKAYENPQFARMKDLMKKIK